MIGSLWGVALAAGVFLAVHVLFSETGLRALLIDALGARGHRAVVSALALASLGWLSWAYAEAPRTPLWPGTPWPALVLMPLVLLFLVAGFTTRSPGPQRGGLDRDNPAPGILRITRNPLLWGVAIWSGVHLIANADAASVAFFGALFVLAVAGSALVDRKVRARLGDDWVNYAVLTSNLPFGAIATGRARLSLAEIGAWRILTALALYGALLAAHGPVLGRSPFP